MTRNKKKGSWPGVAAAEYKRLTTLSRQTKKIIEVGQITGQLLTASIVKRLDQIEAQLKRLGLVKDYDLDESSRAKRWPRWVVYLLTDAPPILKRLRRNVTLADQLPDGDSYLKCALVQVDELMDLLEAGPGPEPGAGNEGFFIDSVAGFMVVDIERCPKQEEV